MTEKDVIRRSVIYEWNKLLKFRNKYGVDAIETKIQRERWATLDILWINLYDDEYLEGDFKNENK